MPPAYSGGLSAQWSTEELSRSRNNVGQQLALKPAYLILQKQLPLFKTLDLKLVERTVLRQVCNDVIEVPMFNLQPFEPTAKFFPILFQKRNPIQTSK